MDGLIMSIILIRVIIYVIMISFIRYKYEFDCKLLGFRYELLELLYFY